LGGQPLLPNSNPAGYLQQPPFLLTTLDSLPAFDAPAFPTADLSRPVSAIRVRVAGLHGTTRQQLDQIAAVALAISQRTGLRVDVTAGSSGSAVTVDLPAGAYGRPALHLSEGWIRKGVGLVILDAADRKSVVLFTLILVVTTIFLSNAAFAAVRGRRREIGILRALGWRRATIFRLVLGEIVLTGTLAAVASTAVAGLLVWLLSLRVPADRLLLVTPVALLLTVAAGTVPAVLAATGQPMDTLLPAVHVPRRATRVRGSVGLTLANLRRTPGRAVLSGLALALGVAALAVLLAADHTFGASIGDSFLSTLVSTQVRSVDYLSTGLAIVLGAVSIADMVYLGIRERSAELAVLLATGWRLRHLSTIALLEATATALVGAGAGAAAAAALGAPTRTALTALGGAVLVVLAVTWFVLRGVVRPSLVTLLAEEE
jgi:ABC-type antimicrobial peptide transport system permease subunit